MLLFLVKLDLGSMVVGAGLYAGLPAALTIQFVQTHAVYLHAFQMTGNKNLNVPKIFGFLRGQVTPFNIHFSDGTPLHAWHILPIGLHRKQMTKLMQQPVGLVADVTGNLSFHLLRDDPNALLAIHFHGASGTRDQATGYPTTEPWQPTAQTISIS
jgi:abhydrolase domain-containing protein 12